MSYSARPRESEYAPFFAGYVARVPEGDIVSILSGQLETTCAPLAGLDDTAAEHAYAPGKWTVKEVVGHLADSERVLCYRALRIARGDATPMAAFDEDAYVAAAGFGRRTLDDLIEDLRTVRRATVALFEPFDPEVWMRRGIASGSEITVRALACIIAGHELHHREILAERYGVPAGG